MRKKIIYYSIALLSIFSLFFYLITPRIFSADCTLGMDLSGKSPDELNGIVAACGQKVNDLRSTANTLSSQIQYMNTQIYLTTIKIQATEQKITDMQKEIELLTGRIEGLDKSLNYLSKTLLERIVQNYKTQSVSLLNLFLDSSTAFDFLNKAKYQKTTQENNQKLLMQVQESKLNFEEQKKIREKKKAELANLISSLDSQKTDLKNQQDAKKNLLAVTQNDESTYAQLLERARQELAGFTAFTKSTGDYGLKSFGNGTNGWYYTQRDPQWGNMILPGSSSSVLLAGCAVTSVAMVCKSYGQSTTPATIVNNSSNFIGGDLLNPAFRCDGKSTNFIGASYETIKSDVKNNIPVILRLISPSVSGLHFVVVWGWDDGSNDFKMHDPYQGPDLHFSDKYSWSQVTNAIVIN